MWSSVVNKVFSLYCVLYSIISSLLLMCDINHFVLLFHSQFAEYLYVIHIYICIIRSTFKYDTYICVW